MLVTSKEVLTEARKNHYAVPAFDCVEDVFVRAVLETADEAGCPAFVMCHPSDLESGDDDGWAFIPGLVKAVADHYDLPVVLHLDHAKELETIQRAVDLGFTSVMIDGSHLSLEENIEITRAAVDIAHPRGVSVEGELGFVGGFNLEMTEAVENVLTQPEEVVEFAEKTNVDALAVSIGTAHGVYQSLPTLNIERLDELNQVSEIPLVLHGGSGTPEDQIVKAVEHGICKLNIYADCRVAMWSSLRRLASEIDREDPLPKDIFAEVRKDMGKTIRRKMDLLGAVDRVTRTEKLKASTK
jgi:fructose-bisphosphate aldolase class II